MTDFRALDGLDRPTLIQLAELFEAGLLGAPFARLTVGDHLPAVHAENVAACVGAIAERKASTDQIALVPRAFAAGTRVNEETSPEIEVVVSGPDPSRTARETSVVTRSLFENARTRVLAVGFAVHQGHTVFRELAERHDDIEALKVTLCLDVRRPPSNTSIDTLLVEGSARILLENEWPGKRAPEMFYDPRSLAASETTRSALHAKCIVVDGRKALVTSANFTEAAQERNIELGLLLRSAAIAARIEEHFRGLIGRGHLLRLPMSHESSRNTQGGEAQQ